MGEPSPRQQAEALRDEARRIEHADDAKRLRNLRRRVNRARNFPHNTCPASRHLHMIADALAAGKPYHGCDWEPWDREDQRWIAESILATLAALWEARARLSALELKP